MRNERRDFFCKLSKSFGAVAVASCLQPLWAAENKLLQPFIELGNQEEVTSDEDFWAWVHHAYSSSPNVIDLNNGGVSPQPIHVQDAVDRYTRLSNEAPSYYMWRTLDQARESLRIKLADLAGCSPEEIAINRNASEALETVIFGLNLQKGENVVLCKQDYPNMINAYKQRQMREGVTLKWVNLALPIETDQEMIDAYCGLIDKNTKVLHLTQVINWTGQVLPCKKIVEKARSINPDIEVVIDGAHAFAQLDFKIPDLAADYFGTSLHKWLCAPFGTGMLYVKKEKIPHLWPMFAAQDPKLDDIRKFEALGTRSFPAEMATGHAINFHLAIGPARKQKRLQYLKSYWLEQVLEIPEVHTYSSLKPEYGCAIGNFYLDGMTPHELGKALFKKGRIHTTTIIWENIAGVRVTPNVYTRTQDLDRLVKIVKELASGKG